MGASRNRKPRAKPKVKYPGVEPVFSQKVWKFRARFRGGGKATVGTLRETQIEAHEDFRKLSEAHRTGGRRKGITLAEALAIARSEAIDRGIAPSTLKSHFEEIPRYLFGWWSGDVPLELLTVKEIARMIREAVKEGRSPNSLWGKDLLVLGQAFQAARLENPVPEAKKVARLKKVPVVKVGLEFTAALQFIEGIRASGTDRSAWHADVVELVLWTGARSSEVTSLTVKSPDMRQGVLQLEGKTGRRLVPMDGPLLEVVKRLVRDAKARKQSTLIPGGKDGLVQIFKRWSKRLGVKASARAMRHTIALGMIESGLSLDKVRDQLGHARITTTAEYINQRPVAKAENLGHLRKHFASPDPDDTP